MSDLTAVEIQAHLSLLQLERLEARSAGLDECQTYMTELDDEIADCRTALAGAAVTEIAVLRGELFGRQEG